jgi:hypothetical protein
MHMRPSSIAAAIALVVLGAAATDAKTLYVNASTGNDATSYAANSQSAPWRTIARAAWGSTVRSSPNTSEAARAGDVVIVAAGVYTTNESGSSRNMPVLNPANSGTSGSPIIFQAAAGARVEIRSSGYGGPAIGTNGRNYIIWDGFYIDEAYVNTVADTGPVVVWASNNVTLRNLELRGKHATWSDNHNAVRIEQSDRIWLQNSVMHNFTMSQRGRNGSAVMVYYGTNIVIENNTIHSSDGGIFVKGANMGPFTIRRNLIYNVTSDGMAFGGLGLSSGSAGAVATQNVVRGSQSGVAFIGYDAYSPANVLIANNTFYNNEYGAFFKPNTAGYRNIRIFNNLISTSIVSMQGEDVADLSNVSAQHNFYHAGGTHARLNYANYTLAQWQSTLGKDNGSPAGRVGDPLFVSASNNDFHLQSGSPARSGGIDVADLNGNGSVSDGIAIGAYITGTEVIGASASCGSCGGGTGGGGTTTPPSAPSGVRIVTP